MAMRTVLGLLCFFVSSALLSAQATRYELGRRLRVFEAEWEKTPGEESRRGTVTPLNQAVTAFFTFRLGDAGRAIDQARFSLDAKAQPSPARRWAESLALFPAQRLVDTAASELSLELKPFYEVPRPADGNFSIQLELFLEGKRSERVEFAIRDLPQKMIFKGKRMPEGDHRLRYAIAMDKEVLARGEMGISAVDRLTDRLGVLAKVDAAESKDVATEHASLQAHARLLQALHDGRVEETDYPAARLLREAEDLRAAIAARKPFFTKNRAGEFWIQLVAPAAGDAAPRTFPLRLLAPKRMDGKMPPPLVVALHGAGGSENLFFDGYGNGKIVRLCQERGWMLVAPRVGFSLPLARMLDELERRFPFDRERVFLVGHSMGAGQALAAVGQEPKRYAGVVALGGGGTVKASDDLKKVPFFVGIGDADFALSGARGLRDRLAKAGVERVTYRELKNIEHLGIVQQSLDESFQFLEDLARKGPPR